jgi:type IV pilus assembly protein PilN
MIKINLLPTKKKPAKKVTELQQQLILGTLILGISLFGMWSYWKSLDDKIDTLTKEKTAADAKINEQTKMLDDVKTVEDDRKKVGDKIAIIEQLKKNQTALVHLLDEVGKALPQGVNITSLAEDNGKVSLEGTSFTNNEVVRLIDNLKASPYLSDVFLQETAQAQESGVDIYKYKLQFIFRGV